MQETGDLPEPAEYGGPFVGHKLDRKTTPLLADAARELAPDERVLGLFRVLSMRPQIDVLLVTNARLVGGMAPSMGQQFTIKWSLPAHQVSEVELKKGMTTPGTSPGRILLHQTDGTTASPGTLRYKADAEAFVGTVAQMSSTPVPSELAAAVAAGEKAGTDATAAVAPEPTDVLPEVAPEPTDVLPEKARDLGPALLAALHDATEAARRGDLLAEEAALRTAKRTTKQASLLSRRGVAQWLSRQIEGRIAAGELRIGAQHLGTVKEGGSLEQILGGELQVYSDRIVYKDEAHVLDEYVSAFLEVDGQVLVSHRPTLTRMAATSMLPGSALLPGLALQKQEKQDNRRAHFAVVHPDWRIVVPVNPDRAQDLKPLATQVNSIAQRLQAERAKKLEPAPGTAPPSAASSGGPDQLEQLERIQRLVHSGIIDEEQAKALTRKVLGQE